MCSSKTRPKKARDLALDEAKDKHPLKLTHMRDCGIILISSFRHGHLFPLLEEVTLTQPRVHASERQQFFMPPAFHNPSMIHHQDLIGMTDSR